MKRRKRIKSNIKINVNNCKILKNITYNDKIGSRSTEFTLAEYPLMDEHSEMNLRSNDTIKQEESNLTRL